MIQKLKISCVFLDKSKYIYIENIKQKKVHLYRIKFIKNENEMVVINQLKRKSIQIETFFQLQLFRMSQFPL